MKSWIGALLVIVCGATSMAQGPLDVGCNTLQTTKKASAIVLCRLTTGDKDMPNYRVHDEAFIEDTKSGEVSYRGILYKIFVRRNSEMSVFISVAKIKDGHVIMIISGENNLKISNF